MQQSGSGGVGFTFWHFTPQNQAVWHLLHLSRSWVVPQLAAWNTEAQESEGHNCA